MMVINFYVYYIHIILGGGSRSENDFYVFLKINQNLSVGHCYKQNKTSIVCYVNKARDLFRVTCRNLFQADSICLFVWKQR